MKGVLYKQYPELSEAAVNGQRIKDDLERVFVQVCQKIAELEHELATAKRVRVDVLGEMWGCAPGMVVESNGSEYRVLGVLNSQGGRKPWVKGQRRKKDGRWTEAGYHLYGDWEPTEGVVE